MRRYLLPRLLLFLPALLLLHFLGFAYAHFARPIRAARLPFFPVVIEPAPLLPTYTAYLREAVSSPGFGSMPNGEPLAGAIGGALLNSLGLAALAMLIATVLGLALGLLAVNRDPPRVRTWLTGLSSLGLAMPSFYVGTLAIQAIVLYLLNAPPEAESPLPLSGFGWDAHLVLPVLALALRPTVQVARVTATLIAEELHKQYILTARAIGNPWRWVIRRHALSNVAAQTVLTLVASLRLLIGELVVVEWLFRWPGIGRLLATTLVPAELSNQAGAPLFLDPVVMAAVVLCIGLIFLLSDLLASTVTRAVDPRLRTEEARDG